MPAKPILLTADYEISEGNEAPGEPVPEGGAGCCTGGQARSSSRTTWNKTVIAEVDVGGEPHLVKYSRYHDNQQFWTVPGERDERIHKSKTYTVTEPEPDEYELYDLTVNPYEERNLAHPMDVQVPPAPPQPPGPTCSSSSSSSLGRSVSCLTRATRPATPPPEREGRKSVSEETTRGADRLLHAHPQSGGSPTRWRMALEARGCEVTKALIEFTDHGACRSSPVPEKRPVPQIATVLPAQLRHRPVRSGSRRRPRPATTTSSCRLAHLVVPDVHADPFLLESPDAKTVLKGTPFACASVYAAIQHQPPRQ